MGKEKFNWKGLFINDENDNEDTSKEVVPKKTTENTTSFPKTKVTSKFPTSAPITSKANIPTSTGNKLHVSSNVLNTIIEMYEAGFESLNQPGYDFYEFFKAIKAVGSNEPTVYKMALTMAQSVDSKVTKSALLSQADYYIKEIEKVHKQYSKQGNSKKISIEESQKNSKQNLITEISALEKQLMEIQNQISLKKNELHSLDTNISSELSEIEQKIAANDTARSKILETIVTVVNGIKNNL
ncbi:hypothetical protein [Aquimarina sp. RZ0]|uniref:hypothetical protein n=1 Tax=Aquimarina sp. RZ0 TaxID=2607730 RepID=UPI0011F2557F|nr:hypothetical protein [Aquimarina sp. RZ0]KAA1246832.1 hypothetical protein F0000_06120 [Aquimarina sp. RZ0]